MLHQFLGRSFRVASLRRMVNSIAEDAIKDLYSWDLTGSRQLCSTCCLSNLWGDGKDVSPEQKAQIVAEFLNCVVFDYERAIDAVYFRLKKKNRSFRMEILKSIYEAVADMATHDRTSTIRKDMDLFGTDTYTIKLLFRNAKNGLIVQLSFFNGDTTKNASTYKLFNLTA